MTTTLQLLTDARALIAKGWTRRAFARDKTGTRVPYNSPQASCFCITGALNLAEDRLDNGNPITSDTFYCVTEALRDAMPMKNMSLVNYNDHYAREQSDILDMFDKAIEKARADI